MLHAVIWITAAFALGLWSLAAWLLVEAVQLGQDLAGRLTEWAAHQPYARWLDDWFPGWQELLRSLGELMQSLLGWLGGAAPWWPWALWAVGAVGVLLVASVFSLIVAALSPARGAARSAPRT